MTTLNIVSTYMSNKIIDHVLRNTAYTPTASVYIALYKSSPTKTWGGGLEVSGTGYSRVTVTGGFSLITPPSDTGQSSIIGARNSANITFPTSLSNWGIVTHVAVMNAASSGSVLFFGELDTPKSIYEGEIFTISAGDLKIYFNSQASDNTTPLVSYFTVYLAQEMLDHILNNNSWSSPGTNVFCALYTSNPNIFWGSGTEVSAGDYSRLKISGSSWSNPTSGSTGTLIPFQLSGSTIYNWGTITGIGLASALTGGSNLFIGPLVTSETIELYDGFKFEKKYLKVFVN